MLLLLITLQIKESSPGVLLNEKVLVKHQLGLVVMLAQGQMIILVVLFCFMVLGILGPKLLLIAMLTLLIVGLEPPSLVQECLRLLVLLMV